MSRRYPKIIQFRVSEDELRDWSASAARYGTKLSAWIREACARLCDQQKPTKRRDADDR